VHLVLHETSEPIVEPLRQDIAVIRREVYPSDLVPDRKGREEADDAGTYAGSPGFLDHIEVLQVQQTPQVPTGPQVCGYFYRPDNHAGDTAELLRHMQRQGVHVFRFDQALYTDAPVTQRTLAGAFTPARVREGRSTYGFGWNIVTDSDGKRVWHQGNTAGFRAFIERRLSERITVIMLTNGGDTNRMAINDSIQGILKAAPS